MSATDILTDVKKGNLKPVYFLQGEEPYDIDRISDAIEQHALTEEERSFNQSILYGKETDIQAVLSEAKRFPMMAPRQVVIVREAQEMRQLIPTGEDAKCALTAYAKQPQPTTVLVFCHKYKKLDGRKKQVKEFQKAVQAAGTFFTSERVKDWNLAGWITARVKERGYGVDPRTATLLAEYLGNDLSKIDNELSKLFIDMKPGEGVTAELVEENIGISKDYNVFELQNALLKRDVNKANGIILYFAQNIKQHPLPMLTAVLYSFFMKLLLAQKLISQNRAGEMAKVLRVNPYVLKDYQAGARSFSNKKLKRIISYLRETDVRSKGVDNHGTDHGDLMKELVFKITH